MSTLEPGVVPVLEPVGIDTTSATVRRKSQRAFSIIKCTKAAVQREVNDLNL